MGHFATLPDVGLWLQEFLLQHFRLYRDIWVSRDYSLYYLLGHRLSTFIQYIYWALIGHCVLVNCGGIDVLEEGG